MVCGIDIAHLPKKDTIMKPTPDYDTTHNVQSAAEGGGSILRHTLTAMGVTLILTIFYSGVYPFIVWSLAQLIFPAQANGSLIKKDGTTAVSDAETIGSSLLGQNFSLPGYFHPRPSAAGSGYDATSSGGTNLGPLSQRLINGATKASVLPSSKPGPDVVDFDGIRDRIVHYCLDNNIAYDPPQALRPFTDFRGNVDDVKLIKAFNADPNFAFTPKALIPGDAVTGSASGLDPHISPQNAKLQCGRVAAARNIKVEQVQKFIDDNTDAPSLGVFGDPGVNVLRLNIALDAKYPITK
jgi:K+-transporting ATPase ATPase C chain